MITVTKVTPITAIQGHTFLKNKLNIKDGEALNIASPCQTLIWSFPQGSKPVTSGDSPAGESAVP
jgi:hypothetical protein